MRSRNFWLAFFLLSSPIFGEEAQPITTPDPLAFRSSKIDYFGEQSSDVITKLRTKIDTGDVILRGRETYGYLLDLLDALNVSVSSQTLVFSRTSLQEQLISPKNPRAIYFNDEVAIGWIPGSPLIEIAAQDPVKGAMFYTLEQPDASSSGHELRWLREERCIECHVNTATLNVPGYMIRSLQVDEFGERDPQGITAEITHAIPFEKRWGGWYVTGSAKNLVHIGNLIGDDDTNQHDANPSFRGTMTELAPIVDLTKYPSAHSDIVALSVLDHQMHFYNLLTRVQYEHQLGVHTDAEEQFARYALMQDEAPCLGPIKGSTEFANWYQSHDLQGNQGPSLRQLNLKSRLFEYRLSPLVKSRAFQQLPSDVKSRLWERFRKERGQVVELALIDSNQSVGLSLPQPVVKTDEPANCQPASSCQPTSFSGRGGSMRRGARPFGRFGGRANWR